MAYCSNGRMKSLIISLLLVATVVVGSFVSTIAEASGWYVRPKAGAALNLTDEESSYALGAAIGYQWAKHFLSAEVGYTRIFSDPDADLAELTGRLGWPFGFLIPYAIAGVGGYKADVSGADFESLLRLGLGSSFNLIPFLTLNLELSYLNVAGDTNFLEPAAVVGINF